MQVGSGTTIVCNRTTGYEVKRQTMNKLIASGIVVIGWGLLIVGLVGCSTGSATQIPSQAPAAQASVSASPQAGNGSVAQAPSQAVATQASVGTSPQASSVSVTQVSTQ